MMELLKSYFASEEDVCFAFLFGSAARDRIRKGSDIDIAVYFWPAKNFEWEAIGNRYKNENRICLDLERILRKEVDLVVLNRAKAILADEIIRKGKPIIIKDQGIFMDFMCIVNDEAEYMREWLLSHKLERKIATSR